MGMVRLVVDVAPDPITPIGNINVQVRWVILEGTNLYVYGGQGGISPQKSLSLYDFSNPASPSFVKFTGVTSASWLGVDFVPITKVGDYVFTVDQSSNIYSIDTTTSPMTIVDTLSTSFSTLTGLYDIGNNHIAAPIAAQGGIKTIDISDPTNLVESDSEVLFSIGDSWDRLTMDNNQMLLGTVDDVPDYFAVYSLSNPSVINTTPLGTLNLTGFPYDIPVAKDGYFYSVRNSPKELIIIDYNTPSSPAVAFSGVISALGGTPRITVNGNLFAMIQLVSNDVYLSLYDVTDKSDPILMQMLLVTSGTSPAIRGVWIYDNYIFVSIRISSVERLLVFEIT